MTCTAPPLAMTLGRAEPAAYRCSASDVLCWSGLPALADAATDAVHFVMRRVPAGTALFVEGQPFDKLYLVSGGSFKCVQFDGEGYEQVLSFAIHGDMIGLDGLGRACHGSGATALEDATVVVLPMRDFLAQGRQLPALESLLHHAVGTEVARRGAIQYLMAAASSEVRVVRFLLQFSERQLALGHSGRRLRLCMTRRDIASHLGVAHETVSRSLKALTLTGCIRVSNRDIELLDPEALDELQRVTRSRQGRESNGDGARPPMALASHGQASASTAGARLQ